MTRRRKERCGRNWWSARKRPFPDAYRWRRSLSSCPNGALRFVFVIVLFFGRSKRNSSVRSAMSIVDDTTIRGRLPTRRWSPLVSRLVKIISYAAMERTSWTHGHPIVTHSGRSFTVSWAIVISRSAVSTFVAWSDVRVHVSPIFLSIDRGLAWPAAAASRRRIFARWSLFVQWSPKDVPTMTTSPSTSHCSPRWRYGESATTAVSRPKRRAPTGVSCARARSRSPAGRSSRRGRCSRWSGRRSARTPVSACPTPSPAAPDCRRAEMHEQKRYRSAWRVPSYDCVKMGNRRECHESGIINRTRW